VSIECNTGAMYKPRRSKVQIKPKVSTRSMTSTADKPTADSDAKTLVDSPLKEVPIGDQMKTLPQISKAFTSLTTRITPVLAEEEEEVTETVDENDSLDVHMTHDTIDALKPDASQPMGDTIDDKEVTKDKETTDCGTDDKPKDCENKTKCVSKETPKTAKETTTRKRKASRKSIKYDRKDRSVMTMKDLIHNNPPMTDEQKEMRDKDIELTDKQSAEETAKEEEKEEPIETEKSEPSGGPRVKVGADGVLILDEESVIVKRKKCEDRDEKAVIERAGTTSAFTNYSSFRSKTRGSSKPRWTEHETIRFYSALNTIGTDFTLMADLFFRGKRSRLDLRNKFKKEEKINKQMIDDALFSTNTFINVQCTQLDALLNDDSSDDSDDDTTDHTIALKSTTAHIKTK
jgi:hypothetical protein